MTARDAAANASRALTQCIGKDRFASQALASQVAGRTRSAKEAPLQPYHCTSCRCWHVGSKNPVQRYSETQRRRVRRTNVELDTE